MGGGGNARYFNDNNNGMPTSIDSKTSILNSIQIYPNPAKDHFIINGYMETTEKITVDIKDAQAKLVKQAVNAYILGPYNEKISTDYFSPGIYFIHIQIGNQSMVKKLIIMK